MPTPTSYGLVLLSPPGNILLAHATGTPYWDIPKGGPDDGETPVETVLREAREEAGLLLQPHELRDLGRIEYRSDKHLHLFAARTDAFNITGCRCTSFFTHPKTQRRTPEMDDFCWFAFDAIPAHCGKNMARVLTRQLDLAALLDSLPQTEVRLCV